MVNMTVRLLLGVIYALIVADLGLCRERTAESDAVYRKIQKLYQQTADDNMRCWWHIHAETIKKCQDETLQLKHDLLDTVKEAQANGILQPKSACGEYTKGYAEFFIGDQFGGNVELPCDEHAFDPPRHSAKEYRDMNYKLKDLWNTYNSMCVQKFYDLFSSKNINCDEQKWNRGQELAKAIHYAEQEDYITKNCQPDGIGSYSFTQGMDPTDMPCKPMPEGTKYGDPGTIKQS